MAKIKIEDLADKLEALHKKIDSLSVMVSVGTPDEYLVVEKAAEFMGISKSTLYKWVCYRKIPFTKTGKILRFRKGDLIMFFEKHLQTPYNG